MPRRVQKSSSKKQQQHQRKHKAAPNTVPKFKYFAKAALAAYPDKDGNPIYLGDAADVQEFTSNGAVSRTRNKTNCEFLHRPGMAVNLNASTFATGLRLTKRLPRKSVIRPDAKKVLKGWSAYDQVLDLFDTDSGRAFAEAVAILNVGTTEHPAKTDVVDAVDKYVDFLTSDDVQHGDAREAFGHMAAHAASLYLLAMTFIETVDLFNHRKGFAKKMVDIQKQPRGVQRWAKSPEDLDRFKSALVESFMEKVKKNKTPKHKAGDNSSGTSDDSEKNDHADDATSSNDNVDSDQTSSTKEKRKKNKGGAMKNKKTKKDKKTKKAVESESESEDQPKKKKANKDMKTKKDDGRKRKDASDSEPEKPPKKNKLDSNPKIVLNSSSETESSDDGPVSKEEAAYASWARGSVQEVASIIATMDSAIGDSKTSSLKALRDLVGSVPAAVLAVHNLGNLADDLAKRDRAPRRAKFAEILRALQEVCDAVEAFYLQQQTALGGAAATSASANAGGLAAAAEAHKKADDQDDEKNKVAEELEKKADDEDEDKDKVDA